MTSTLHSCSTDGKAICLRDSSVECRTKDGGASSALTTGAVKKVELLAVDGAEKKCR